MRRLSFGVLAVAAAASVILSPGPASAAVPNLPDIPISNWDQPGSEPLDGLGMYLYVAPDSPGPSQLPGEYDYELLFSYEGSQLPGALGLGRGPNGPGGGKFVGFATGSSGTVVVPYEWSTGRLYFLFVHRLGDGAWGAWVYDVWADAWTFVGQGQTPVAWGRLAPRSRT